MSAPLRVAIVGVDGRMGAFAKDLLERSSGIALVAGIRRGDDLRESLRAARAQVGLEVTRAGLGFEHGRILLECGVRPVIGTSGVTLEETVRLDALARGLALGGLVVPNFSLGMCLLQRAAEDAAVHFAKAEIIEMHHEKKRDAPSGTALDTAARMKAAREDSSVEIPIHSVRLPGMYAHQEVILGGRGEIYTLRHDMAGTEAFGPGILRGLAYAARAEGVGRGIGLAFDLAPAESSQESREG